MANQWILEKEEDLRRIVEHAHFPLLLSKKQHYRPDNMISLSNLTQLEQYFWMKKMTTILIGKTID